eukprot:749165-Rhodomonas_salina.3
MAPSNRAPSSAAGRQYTLSLYLSLSSGLMSAIAPAYSECASCGMPRPDFVSMLQACENVRCGGEIDSRGLEPPGKKLHHQPTLAVDDA